MTFPFTVANSTSPERRNETEKVFLPLLPVVMMSMACPVLITLSGLSGPV